MIAEGVCVKCGIAGTVYFVPPLGDRPARYLCAGHWDESHGDLPTAAEQRAFYSRDPNPDPAPAPVAEPKRPSRGIPA